MLKDLKEQLTPKPKKGRSWKAWLVYGAIMAGGAWLGMPLVFEPVAEGVSLAVDRGGEGG
jgi:hypothetical protein